VELGVELGVEGGVWVDATVGVDDWPEPEDESQPGKSSTKGNIAIAEARARASRGARRSAQGKYALNVLSPKMYLQSSIAKQTNWQTAATVSQAAESAAKPVPPSLPSDPNETI
jgi:hypothetical protein